MESLQNIPIDKIYESSTNPRRTFRRMDELIESIKEKGVLVPLLLRPTDEGYEIIAGARRYRAAVAAALDFLPAIVRGMSDEEALEIQVLENLQRADVDPLEEADGYKALLERTSYDVKTLAVRIGKSETYIYQRMKLADLIQVFRDALCEDRITISHAIILARLTKGDQEKAVEVVFDEWSDQEQARPCHIKELLSWIESEIHLDLKRATFKLADADLLPDIGDCISCTKRTGFVPQLFPDIAKKDTCTDGACYQCKVQAHIAREIDKAQKKEKSLTPVATNSKREDKTVLPPDKYHKIEGKEDRCANTHKAIVVEGYSDRGKIIDICTDPECPVHGKKQPSTAEETSWEKEQRLQKEKRTRERAVRKAIYEEITSSPGHLTPIEIKRMATLTLVELLEACGSTAALSVLGKGTREISIGQAIKMQIPTFSAEDLDLTTLRLCLCRLIIVRDYSNVDRPEMLTNIAALHGVDIKAIEKNVDSDLRKKKKQSSETKSKKRGTKASKAETKSKQRGTIASKAETPASCEDCVNTSEAECDGCANQPSSD